MRLREALAHLLRDGSRHPTVAALAREAAIGRNAIYANHRTILNELRQASSSWQRYLALKPAKPDVGTANIMVQAYGPSGLKNYPDAVTAMEMVIDNGGKETANLYAQLAILAAGAKQDRKSELAEQKAIALAPKDQRKQLKSEIDLEKSQLGVTQAGQSQSG